MRAMCQCGVGANRSAVKLQGTACVRILTYPLFLQYARGWGFISVYRLAINAKTRKGDGGAD